LFHFSRKAISSWVRDKDEIVEPGASQLHFQGDSKQKTFVGGLASMAVTGYFLFMVYTNGRKLIMKGDNSINSLMEQMNYGEVGKVYLDKMAKPLLEVL